MIKMFSAIIGCVFFLQPIKAQKPDPVHWQYSARKIDDETYELHIKATMDEPWHIYSQTQPKEAIAIPTKITFSKNPLITIAGIPKEVGKKEKYTDDNAGIVQYQYGGTLEFVQTVTLKAAVKTTVAGTIIFQTCNNEMCLPAKTIPFTIAIE